MTFPDAELWGSTRTYAPNSYTLVGDPQIKRFTFSLSTAHAGVLHTVRVAGVNERRLSSEWAGPLSAAPNALPGGPLNLTITPGDGKLTVTWDPPVHVYPPIDFYRVAYRLAGAEIWEGWWLQVSTGTVIEGLTNGQPYQVRVSAMNPVTPPEWYGGNSAWGTATPAGPDPNLPGAPRNVTLTAGNGWIVVEWDTPEFAGNPPLHGYRIRYREARGVDNPVVPETLWHDDLSINAITIDSGLTNGNRYEVWVEAVNTRDGEPRSGPAAGPKRATPQELGPAVPPYPERQPSAPRNLTLTAGDGQITVSWEAPSRLYNSNPRYLVEYRKVGGAWFEEGLASSPTTIEYLESGTTYEVRVTVFDTYGEATAGPERATPGTAPTAPRNLRPDAGRWSD